MGKSSPSEPTPPDPVKTANAQASANKDTAITQAQLNMVDQYTPYGSLTYEQINNAGPTFDQSAYDQAVQAYQSSLQDYNSGDTGGVSRWRSSAGRPSFGGGNDKPAAPNPNDYYVDNGGTPRYAATTTLSPEQQSLYDLQTQAQQQYGQIANNQLGQVSDTLSQPLDFASLGAAPQADQQAWDTAYQSMIQRNQPQADRSLEALRTRLANQGIDYGSDAYRAAMDDYTRGQNDFGLGAQQFATQQMAQRYGMESNARQQAIDEMLKQRSVPINELAAMLSGSQVQNPSFVGTPQTQINPADVMGATYASYNGAMNNYNAQMGASNAQNQGLFGLIGTGAQAYASNPSAFSFSDARLKKNIVRVGDDPRGFGLYEYDFIWGDRERGVIAQEVIGILPVAVHESGYLMVDYGAL